MSEVKLTIVWKTSDREIEKTLIGRNAWALNELIRSAQKGCTPIDNPAPAWAAYVQNLRAMGFDVETIMEPHGGPFKGHHGRYVLQSNVSVIDWLGYDQAA